MVTDGDGIALASAPVDRAAVERSLLVRPALPVDLPEMVALAGRSLGWRPEDPNEALFRWKHERSPFGPSPAWLAVHEGSVVGIRVLMRWQFLDAAGRTIDAVRAVDTATDPGYQGLGIFSRLTRGAVDALAAAGVAFVFNTPNDQSRPGYLKLGWEILGRVPVGVALQRPSGVARMLRARVPAGKWSMATDVGEAGAAVFGPAAVPADRAGLAALLDGLAARADRPLLATNRTPEFFGWRYADGPLAYRVLRRGRHLEDGFVVFRLRSRGDAVEATICDLVVPDDDARERGALVRCVLAETGADYAIAVRGGAAPSGLLPLPGQGPVFTWRALQRTTVPPLGGWELRLGDIELF